jgi:hypothetical protein
MIYAKDWILESVTLSMSASQMTRSIHYDVYECAGSDVSHRIVAIRCCTHGVDSSFCRAFDRALAFFSPPLIRIETTWSMVWQGTVSGGA